MSDEPWPPLLRWPDEPLTDGVVVLDRLTFDDVDRVVFGCTDDVSQRWLPLPSPYTDAEARSFIGSRDSAADEGKELTFAVRDAVDHTLVGAMGITVRGHRWEVEIGYWTTPDRRGRGWTARAVRLLAAYALHTMPVRRVEILAALGNSSSLRVAERAGATYEGVRRSGMPSPDVEEDAAVYSFVTGDLPALDADLST